jgi:hypothetical protein
VTLTEYHKIEVVCDIEIALLLGYWPKRVTMCGRELLMCNKISFQDLDSAGSTGALLAPVKA